MNTDQSEILQSIKDTLMITLNSSYAIVDFDTITVFAKESLPYLIRILEVMKGLFTVTKGSPDKAVEEQKQSTSSLLEKAYVLLSEGADFTYERVFETPHPYPRYESVMKDIIHVPKAIAYTIELDKRCLTETN